MSLKQIAIGTAVLAVLAVAGFAIDKSMNSGRREVKSLADGVDFSQGKVVRIQANNHHVTLQATETGWVVVEKANFPADEAKLRKLVIQLSGSQIEHKVTERKEKLGELGLLTILENEGKFEEDTTGQELSVEKVDGQVLFKLIIGNTRSTSAGYGGQYVRPAGETVAYLIPEALQLDPEPKEWINKSLFPIKGERDLQKISIRRPGAQPLIFSRTDEKTPWELEGVKAEDLDVGKVTTMVRDVAGINLSDLAEEGKSEKELGRTKVTTAELTGFDQRTFRITVGEEKVGESLRYVAIQAGLPADVKDEKLRQEVDGFNARFSNRFLAVFDWEGDTVLKTVKDFRKEQPKKP